MVSNKSMLNVVGGSECVTSKPINVPICERRCCQRNTCFEGRLL